jgi:hypothetical protein
MIELEGSGVGKAISKINEIFSLAEEYKRKNALPSYFGRVESSVNLYIRKHDIAKDGEMSERLAKFCGEYRNEIIIPLFQLIKKNESNLEYIGMDINILDKEKQERYFDELLEIIKKEEAFRSENICSQPSTPKRK